jgi:hypothetical protein
MQADKRTRGSRGERLLAFALIVAALAMSGVSLTEAKAGGLQRRVQSTPGTPPLKGTPAPGRTGTPADSKPGGPRPTTPALQPAHPDPRVPGEGAKSPLPPAPAEKIGPPIKQK